MKTEKEMRQFLAAMRRVRKRMTKKNPIAGAIIEVTENAIGGAFAWSLEDPSLVCDCGKPDCVAVASYTAMIKDVEDEILRMNAINN